MNRDSFSDEELMCRYRDGDTNAFDALYARHKGKLFRYILRQCRARAEAEELFQDIWINLIRARHRYEVQAKFTTYLYHLAHNKLIDHFRANSVNIELSLDDEDLDLTDPPAPFHAQPERQVELKQDIKKFFELLDALSVVQKEVFLLHEEAGLSIEEIAQVTGINKEAAKSRLRYAVNKLKSGLSK